MKRKHILLKNEIENLQMLVKGEVGGFADFYNRNLIERLEQLKCKWYKVKRNKEMLKE